MGIDASKCPACAGAQGGTKDFEAPGAVVAAVSGDTALAPHAQGANLAGGCPISKELRRKGNATDGGSQAPSSIAKSDKQKKNPSRKTGQQTSTAARKKVEYVPFEAPGGKFRATRDTEALLERIGGQPRLLDLTSRFYGKMFTDAQMQLFFEDKKDPHAERLANWIAEKMGGPPDWSLDLPHRAPGQPKDRQRAHLKAWNCKFRQPDRRGKHFKLDDAVTWMRLMFWSVREEGLDEEPFFSWFVEFIRHFVVIYESQARKQASMAADWSASPSNLEKYRDDGWWMEDLEEMRNDAADPYAPVNA